MVKFNDKKFATINSPGVISVGGTVDRIKNVMQFRRVELIC